jgi:PAS domain S-box-containing protein
LNKGARRINGYEAGEIIGKHFSVFYTEEDAKRGYPEKNLHIAATEGRYGEEGLRVRKDGSRFWAHVMITAMRDEKGNLRGFSKVTHDITERKKVEEALSQSEERYRAVVKQSIEGLYLADADTRRILETNPALQEMLGYSAEELRRMELHEIVAHDRQSVEENIERTLTEGQRFIRERRYLRKDGSEVDVELAASAIYYGSKRVICAAIRDITDRKRAEEALREVREAERQRIARDLHDGVLQDLSYTAMNMEVTKLQAQGTGLEEELQEEIDTIRSAAQALRAVVYDLRLADEADRPFVGLLESLVERSREMAHAQQIELDVKEGFPETTLGQIGTELLRIVQEALTNARRHSGARNILVSLKVEGEELLAEVADDGRGFGPGTSPGIGLRSMRERAASLGGELEIHSGQGQGTTVRLRTPMSAPDRGR